MNILEAKEEIKRAVQAYTSTAEDGGFRLPVYRQRPLLLMGPPGVGKTAVMEQAARECGTGLVAYTMTHHTRQSAVGLPMLEKKSFAGEETTVTSYTMSEIIASVYGLMEDTGTDRGILFLDEINCVSETLMPAMLQFLQYKSFGGHKLPDGWVIAAAGNPTRYNRYARPLDGVLLDRVRLLDIEPDFEAWKSYACARALHPAVTAFLNSFRDCFYIEEKRGSGIVTARTWEDLSELLLLMEDEGITVSDSLFGQYIRDGEAAAKFAVYYRTYEKWKGRVALRVLPDISEVKNAAPGEALCLVWILQQQSVLMGECLEEQKNLAASLEYLRDGMSAADAPREGNSDSAAMLCDALKAALERRNRALQVRKKHGLVSADEEKRERKLSSLVLPCMAKMRSTGDTGLFDGLAADERQKADALSNEFSRGIEECSRFIEEAFGDENELVVYLSGVMDSEACRAVIRKELPELYSKAVRTLDVDEKERALRERLKGAL